jgi:hypothetical protein
LNNNTLKVIYYEENYSVVCWLEMAATDPEVSGSILGATIFPEKQWVWNGILSAS